MARTRRKRPGQPRARDGVIIASDFEIKAGDLTLTQKVIGRNQLETDPRYILWPVVLGAVRALQSALKSTGRASDATVAKRRKPRGTRTPPGPSSSAKQWLDSGFFRNTLDTKWVPNRSYAVTANKNRVQTPELKRKLREQVPIFGNGRLLVSHPQFQEGIEDLKDLLTNKGDGPKRKSRH